MNYLIVFIIFFVVLIFISMFAVMTGKSVIAESQHRVIMTIFIIFLVLLLTALETMVIYGMGYIAWKSLMFIFEFLK